MWGGMMIFGTDNEKLVVGYKQTIKALTQNKAKKVYIAEDIEDRLKSDIENIISADVEKFYVSTRKELGDICNVKIGASCAVILK